MKKPKSQKQKYSGVLNEPMVIYRHGLETAPFDHPNAGTREEADQKDRAQLKERIAALFQHYKIDPGSPSADFTLALGLARDNVPGFRYRDPSKRGRGRSGKWNGFKLLEDF